MPEPTLPFASTYLDPTGLYKMGERYYDSSLGRFTHQDPIVSLIDPMLWNRYVYVGDNPVNYIDPTGTDGQWGVYGCLLGAIGVSVGEFLSGLWGWFTGDPSQVTSLGSAAGFAFGMSVILSIVGELFGAAAASWVGAALLAGAFVLVMVDVSGRAWACVE